MRRQRRDRVAAGYIGRWLYATNRFVDIVPCALCGGHVDVILAPRLHAGAKIVKDAAALITLVLMPRIQRPAPVVAEVTHVDTAGQKWGPGLVAQTLGVAVPPWQPTAPVDGWRWPATPAPLEPDRPSAPEPARPGLLGHGRSAALAWSRRSSPAAHWWGSRRWPGRWPWARGLRSG